MKLQFTHEQWESVFEHLIPDPHNLENAAFVFASLAEEDGLICRDIWLLGSSELAVQLPYHFELQDDVRGQVIKRAHDSGLTIVEMHSHLGDRPAEFSWSDLSGFDSWVKHVQWRLKGAPYGAVVVTRNSFDGFFWTNEIERLGTIAVGNQEWMCATERSPLQWTLPEEWHVGH
ncbi:hypothetical protein [Microcoleus sp. B7-D4]|uniref:hypothetical protein n=1 Tax=Microcoleus sp. B7-D4 TaxID=2818696 RepID=UPI002FD4BE85